MSIDWLKPRVRISQSMESVVRWSVTSAFEQRDVAHQKTEFSGIVDERPDHVTVTAGPGDDANVTDTIGLDMQIIMERDVICPCDECVVDQPAQTRLRVRPI